MIVVDHGATLSLITQPDHARFAGQLLALWTGGGLPSHPRREDLLFAVREHDNGWREADAAPSVDPATGRPHDFTTLPRRRRFEVWERGIGRFRARPYAALLIAEHARALHADRSREPEWDEFLGRIDEARGDLAAEVDLAPHTLAADYRWLELGDALSLAACNRWTRPVDRPGVRGRYEPGSLVLEPFPLAGATSFGIPSRAIPNRRYRGEADLASELGTARWEETTIRVIPGR